MVSLDPVRGALQEANVACGLDRRERRNAGVGVGKPDFLAHVGAPVQLPAA